MYKIKRYTSVQYYRYYIGDIVLMSSFGLFREVRMLKMFGSNKLGQSVTLFAKLWLYRTENRSNTLYLVVWQQGMAVGQILRPYATRFPFAQFSVVASVRKQTHERFRNSRRKFEKLSLTYQPVNIRL